MHTPKAPEGYNTVNPFIITKDAPKVIDFMTQVFGAEENKDAFTKDTDGLILHSELRLGNSTILLAETKPDWRFTPAFMQVYVYDVAAALKKAEELGGTIITKPTDFYGDIFSRVQDPAGNMWWVYQHVSEPSWDEAATEGDEASWDGESKELTYIHDTLIDAMQKLAK